jgi:isopentenyl-diphosphate delta-isomerase
VPKLSEPAITRRKSEHLRIVAEEDVQHGGGTLLDDVQLVHCAMPELNLGEVDLGMEFFGKRLAAPLMITSMTGGAGIAGDMNRALAAAAQATGTAFAVGSQRVIWDLPSALPDFTVRDAIPTGVLLGNIGAAQVLTEPPERIAALVEMIDADGMCVHLNPAQELAQPEGDTRFNGIAAAIAKLVERLEGRVLVKETGAGLSPSVLAQLRDCGVRYIDVAGAGGTSWTKVESHRTAAEVGGIGALLGDWGVPTAFSLLAARRAFADVLDARIVASGGIRSGLDAARAIACGADVVGVARPVLMAYLDAGQPAVEALLQGFIDELRAVLLLCGAGGVLAMQQVDRVYTGRLREWLAAYGWLQSWERA